jgi:hypothetical protein
VLSLTKATVRDLQLEVILHRPKCPLAEDSVLTTHPLKRMRREGGLLRVCVQTHMLLDDDAAHVVLQVEQVLYVLGHLHPSDAELWAHEVTGSHMALVPLGFLLIEDWKEHDQRVSGVGEALFLTQGGECHVHHLLDGIVDLTLDIDSHPRCCGVDWYLHPDLRTVQATGLKGSAAVDGDRPLIALAVTLGRVGAWSEDVHP